MIERLHTADGNTITRLEVSQWHVESALPDFVSLLTNLSQLRVDHLAYHHDEVSVVQPAWDKLTSASMFRNLTYGCDESAIIIHALSDCPELSRLRITIEPAISSLLSPLPQTTRIGTSAEASQHLARNPHVPVENDAAAGAPPDWNVSRWTDGALEPWDVPPQQRFGCDQRGMSQLKTFQLSLPGVYSLTPGQGSRQHMLESIARNNQEIEELVLDASLRLPAGIFFLAAPTTKLDTPRHREINEDNPPLHQHSKGRRAWAGR
ncbi:hypothetical protein CGCA056_v015094 [Colletotrichum aenigma]|uniref:uncharacterized protein n=1 Tax=Colletotrichum aenigma TaxID=1215731 RepID=UPI001872AA4D|nr:uncharacterized protein CGCA056_v015094 [Colletotrichum aenigma]KAF5483152.1 hypothetical protein CGCA056_v015094 [Colletotrichum aenigma]